MKPAFDEKVIQENCDQLINQSEKFIWLFFANAVKFTWEVTNAIWPLVKFKSSSIVVPQEYTIGVIVNWESWQGNFLFFTIKLFNFQLQAIAFFANLVATT